MNFILGILAAAGLWFFIGLFPSLHHSIIANIAGYAVSWFQVIILAGWAVIAKVMLS